MSILSTNTTLTRKLLLLICCALCLLATPLHAAAFQQESHTTSTSSSTGSGLRREVDQQECSTTEDNQTLAEKEREALIIDKYLDDLNKIAERCFDEINAEEERREQDDKRDTLRQIKAKEMIEKAKKIQEKQGKALTTAETVEIIQEECGALHPDIISLAHKLYRVKGKGKKWREEASEEDHERIIERSHNTSFIANEYNLFGELCYCLNMETLTHVISSLLALKRGELSVNAFLKILLNAMRSIMAISNYNILYLNHCFSPETKALHRQYISEIPTSQIGIRYLVESLYDNKRKIVFNNATIYRFLETLAKDVVVCFIHKEGIPLSDANKRTIANMPTLLKRVQGIDLRNPLAWAAGHVVLEKLAKKTSVAAAQEAFKFYLNYKEAISQSCPLYPTLSDCDLLRLVHSSPTFYYISVPIPGVGVANYVDSVAPDQGERIADNEADSFPPLNLNHYLPPQSPQPQASSSAPKQRSISKKAAQHNTKNKRTPTVQSKIRGQQKDKDKKIVPPTGTREEDSSNKKRKDQITPPPIIKKEEHDSKKKERKDQVTPPPIIRRQEEQEDYKGQTTTSTKGLEKEAAGEAPSIEEPHSPTTDDTTVLQDLLNKDSLEHKLAITEAALNEAYDRFTEECRSSVILQDKKGRKLIITPPRGMRHAFHAWFNEIPPSKSLNRRNQEVVDRVFDKKRSKDIPKRALLRVWNDLGGSYSEIGSHIKIQDSEGNHLCFIYSSHGKREKESGFSRESISKVRIVFLMQGAMPTGYHLVN